MNLIILSLITSLTKGTLQQLSAFQGSLMQSPYLQTPGPFPMHQLQASFARDLQSPSLSSSCGATTERITPHSSIPHSTPLNQIGFINLYVSDKKDKLSRIQLDYDLIKKRRHHLVIIKDNEYKKLQSSSSSKSIPSSKSVQTYFTEIDKAFENCLGFTSIIEKKQKLNLLPFYISTRDSLNKLNSNITGQIMQQCFEDYINSDQLVQFQNVAHFLQSAYIQYKKIGILQSIPLNIIQDLKVFILSYWSYVFVEIFALKMTELIEILDSNTFLSPQLGAEIYCYLDEQEKIIRAESEKLLKSAKTYYAFLNGDELPHSNINRMSKLMQAIINVVLLKSDLNILHKIIEWKVNNVQRSTIGIHALYDGNGTLLHRLLNETGYSADRITRYNVDKHEINQRRRGKRIRFRYRNVTAQ